MPIDPKRVLFEDEYLLAVMKLGGELVVAGRGKMEKLPLLDFLRKQYPTLAPIHRLDFETSGVVVFAKTKRVLQTILESKSKGWTKRYLAIVLGHPKRAQGDITFKLIARSGEGKVDASTKYKVLEQLGDCSLVECVIERGQKHQIRRHMNMIGHPLILDQIYGIDKANKAFSRYLKMRRFLLHAESIDFPHPMTGAPVHISSEPPASFTSAVKKLRAAKRS